MCGIVAYVGSKNCAPILVEGLRRFRIHDLRHTFASLLIQDGASLAYVKEQLGHSTIAVTVDLYGHLVPSANIAFVDRLDAKTSPQQNATQAQPADEMAAAALFLASDESSKVTGHIYPVDSGVIIS